MANKQNAKEYPIQIIREDLRRRSTQEAALLARSVGRVTETRFRRVSPGRVRVSGLLAATALPAAS